MLSEFNQSQGKGAGVSGDCEVGRAGPGLVKCFSNAQCPQVVSGDDMERQCHEAGSEEREGGFNSPVTGKVSFETMKLLMAAVLFPWQAPLLSLLGTMDRIGRYLCCGQESKFSPQEVSLCGLSDF